MGNLLKRFKDDYGNFPQLNGELPEIKKVFEQNWDLNNLTEEQSNQAIVALKTISPELSVSKFEEVNFENFKDFKSTLEEELESKDLDYPLKVGKSQWL